MAEHGPFRPGWKATLVAAILLCAALALAIWQLERAEEKADLDHGRIASMAARPIPVAQLRRDESDEFKRVSMHGAYDGQRHFLVDNRTLGGRVGYVVVTLFLEQGGERFLVNRGWVAAPLSRGELPLVPSPSNVHTLEAVVWPDTGLPPLLSDDRWDADWPKRVQRLNVARMLGEIGSGYPYQLRIDADQPGALEQMPNQLGASSDRSKGYAAQWFALCGLVLFGWVSFGIRRARKAREARRGGGEGRRVDE